MCKQAQYDTADGTPPAGVTCGRAAVPTRTGRSPDPGRSEITGLRRVDGPQAAVTENGGVGELCAWVDESGSDRARDPDTYILAAALCAAEAMDGVRELMRPLLTRGHAKVHWREETKPARRAAITDQVRSCALQHVIVVRSGLVTDSSRRPRQAALKRLLQELDQRQVRQAILESRGHDDRHDRDLHARLQRNHDIGGRIKMSHRAGPTDPGLWIADAVCGAVTASRTGTPGYLEMLAEQITMITIDWQGH